MHVMQTDAVMISRCCIGPFSSFSSLTPGSARRSSISSCAWWAHAYCLRQGYETASGSECHGTRQPKVSIYSNPCQTLTVDVYTEYILVNVLRTKQAKLTTVQTAMQRRHVHDVHAHETRRSVQPPPPTPYALHLPDAPAEA